MLDSLPHRAMLRTTLPGQSDAAAFGLAPYPTAQFFGLTPGRVVSAPRAFLSLRHGLSGQFAEFDLLPQLLAAATKTSGSREEVTAVWSVQIGSHGYPHDRIGEAGSAAEAGARSVAADAWRFSERMGLIGAAGLTPEGVRASALADSSISGEPRRVMAAVLARGVSRQLRDHGQIEGLPLLRAGARTLAATTNLWACECPGLIPVEVGSLLHWASVDATRAQRLLRSLVKLRDVAMHRYEAPAPDAEPGHNAALHFDTVSAFYLSHPWLAERVPMSWDEELATCRLLAYCGLLRMVEAERAPACWLVENRPSEDAPAC